MKAEALIVSTGIQEPPSDAAAGLTPPAEAEITKSCATDQHEFPAFGL